MSGILKYKDFYGSIELSYEDKILHGKIECINDLVTYEAETINDLEAAFREAVDDYLDTCKSLGKKPEKPMSGTFNIRIGSELHQKAYLAATENGMKLNEFIKQAVSEKLSAKKEIHYHFESVTAISRGRFTTSHRKQSNFVWTAQDEGRIQH
ncbi:type II toxin-antitoxin system HicB family antitoxin [Citrobacter amalonaticus]|uniref:HicB family protein n=1 Tax=Citrobacter amalonaticus TaxID=35703 RepID=A0A6N2S320_CITAM|nr:MULTISPECIES: type II toxin-antitoxin system HicB family antitoxin [Citrobacter]EKW5096705.1 type II toxin-antitoxin system HicB family antitoxin [Citrobacter amalonaticus]MBJ9318960.1 type II toxin-antitoxin system HicB family antitoxin [Citrobacter amalonaticus]MDM3521775.1 type II toxin-antitoxin system HicB family antitoxin [Citrobacter sp. Ca225]QZA34824.1 type II toxin-antitoxin system HicB family antitoxin [Citrobacter amalonaticus]HBU6574890.1 type II toxin-antitoxin system HicB fam